MDARLTSVALSISVTAGHSRGVIRSQIVWEGRCPELLYGHSTRASVWPAREGPAGPSRQQVTSLPIALTQRQCAD